MPECVTTIYIDGILTGGVTYKVVFENLFGKKTILEKSANPYTGIITIDVEADLPEGYFFRDNSYKLKVYASDDDFECDSPANLCAYETCISLAVYEATGAEEEFTINCCA